MATPAAPAPYQAIEWVKVPGTRRPNDELLVAFTADGIVLRSSLTAPGLAMTYGDLSRVADFVSGADKD